MSRINKNISDEFRAIVLIGILFFIFGFVTWLNSILIPYLRIACELDNFQSYLVTFAFYIATFAMAIPSASIIKKTGFRDAMTIGLLMMAVGAALFIPAAMTRTYSMFLFGLFVTGSGMTLLQTAANPYISVMGPLEFAARRISIMGVFNKTAGILSPLILGAIILKGNENIESHLKTLNAVERAIHLDELAAKVILPYLAMSLILAALSVLIRFSGLPEINLEDDSRKASEVSSRSNIFQFPGLVLGVISLFLYIGVEVMAGDTIISYGISQGIPFS
ncbi:MAG TPA: MFS transporter, partial [Flavitalea sp.]|nr:MFS transporter [Flavitalea sp.]